MSTERPILFSGPMVRAILDGKKTQTRREVRRVPDEGQVRGFSRTRSDGLPWGWTAKKGDVAATDESLRNNAGHYVTPYGVPGDTLWVRETWAPYRGADEPCEIEDATAVRFREGEAAHLCANDGCQAEPLDMYGVPPHKEMPGGPWRWQPSIHMPRWASRITLRITETGLERLGSIKILDCLAEGVGSRPEFFKFWDDIYGENATNKNPWLWVVKFEVSK